MSNELLVGEGGGGAGGGRLSLLCEIPTIAFNFHSEKSILIPQNLALIL